MLGAMLHVRDLFQHSPVKGESRSSLQLVQWHMNLPTGKAKASFCRGKRCNRCRLDARALSCSAGAGTVDPGNRLKPPPNGQPACPSSSVAECRDGGVCCIKLSTERLGYDLRRSFGTRGVNHTSAKVSVNVTRALPILSTPSPPLLNPSDGL